MKFVYFLIHDSNPNGLLQTEVMEKKVLDQIANKHNENGHGVFWCPNFNYEDPSLRRLADTVKYVRYWYCDIDEGTKQEQWEIIYGSPLLPTRIVESKKGFHLYWRAGDDATVDNFSIVEKRLIAYYKADRKAKDIVRILRVPGFMHMKDPKDPFHVKQLHMNTNYTYSETQMFEAYPMPQEEKLALQTDDAGVLKRFASNEVKGDSIASKIRGMNQLDLLDRLSGTEYVNCERYTFQLQTNGNHNIYVNGVSTGCFININNEIIADKYYGNNIINWLKWPDYKLTIREIYDILKRIVPEAF